MLPRSDGKKQAPSTPVDTDEVLLLAQAIHRSGMGGVARITLEALKPLHWIAGQFAWALEPFMGALSPFSRKSTATVSNMARLLEREDGVNVLTAHLDTLLAHESEQIPAPEEETNR